MKPQEFIAALPSDQQIAERALCRANGCVRDCAARPSACVAGVCHGAQAAAVLKALGARKRLMVNPA